MSRKTQSLQRISCIPRLMKRETNWGRKVLIHASPPILMEGRGSIWKLKILTLGECPTELRSDSDSDTSNSGMFCGSDAWRGSRESKCLFRERSSLTLRLPRYWFWSRSKQCDGISWRTCTGSPTIQCKCTHKIIDSRIPSPASYPS